jgi:hypothetical protein
LFISTDANGQIRGDAAIRHARELRVRAKAAAAEASAIEDNRSRIKGR